MIIAAVDDVSYEVALIVHLLASFIAAVPVLQPSLIPPSAATAPATLSATRRIYSPALIITGLLGFGLSGLSEGVHELGETWMLLSIAVWIAMNGVLHAVQVPGLRAIGAGGASGRRRVELSCALLAVLWTIVIYLMVFQPGG